MSSNNVGCNRARLLPRCSQVAVAVGTVVIGRFESLVAGCLAFEGDAVVIEGAVAE